MDLFFSLYISLCWNYFFIYLYIYPWLKKAKKNELLLFWLCALFLYHICDMAVYLYMPSKIATKSLNNSQRMNIKLLLTVKPLRIVQSSIAISHILQVNKSTNKNACMQMDNLISGLAEKLWAMMTWQQTFHK